MNHLLHRFLSLAASALSVPAMFAPATAGAFDVTAKLERDFNTFSGPQEFACPLLREPIYSGQRGF